MDDLQRLIARSCNDLLLPVVRLLLKSGITWKTFCEVGRQAFVEVATREFGTDGRPANTSRVATLTGITRREVRRQQHLLATDPGAANGLLSPAARVLSAWHRDPEFIGPQRRPRDLPLEGHGASLAELVRRYVGGETSVTALLKELQTLGAVAQLADGRIRVNKRAFVPGPMDPAQIRLWANVLRDVGTTLEYNVTRTRGRPARFERRALSLEVDRAALPAFRQLLEVQGEAFLESIDDWLTAHEVQGDAAADAIRLGVGIYHIEDARPKSK
jgi:Family of unknown function (DUF6502)